MRRRSLIDFVYLPHVISLIVIAAVMHQTTVAAAPPQSVEKIVSVSKDLKKHLRIASSLEIRIVENNRLALSVQPMPDRPSDFLLLIDTRFLERLDKEELRAALAHELGHVWIFTHHPYLQTETLANQVAMRAVPRSSLKKLYVELSAFEGTSKNLDKLLGTEQLNAVKVGSEKH